MTGVHPEIGPELRKLAQAVLDGIDPAVRAAAALAALGDPGKCQQVWCPVCALAALVSGEQHPLLTVIAQHSTGLLAMVRAMIADTDADTARTPAPPAESAPPPGGSHPGPTRYQHIPVNVED